VTRPGDAFDADALMRQAIAQARAGIQQGQSPFGCAISLDGKVVAASHNAVFAATDITAHAEIVALRSACEEIGEILLPGAVVACTCEPCPMCMAALHWARVDTVYFGAGIEDAGRIGFNELTLHAEDLLRQGGSSVKLVGGTLRDECIELFREWQAAPGHRSY